MSGGSLVSKELIDRVSVSVDLDLSDGVRQDLEEAATSINAGAPRAAAVMMRRALERCLVERGVSGKTLYAMINKLRDNGDIDEITAGGATAIRFFGNYGAHPPDDLLEEVDLQKAERAFQLTIEILEQLSR